VPVLEAASASGTFLMNCDPLADALGKIDIVDVTFKRRVS
jgi:hypothetical protein